MDWNRIRGLGMDKTTVWDKDFAGLGVRVNKRGSAVYILKYSINGRQVLKTLGDIDFMTKDQARQMAHRMKLLAKQGEDPTFLITSYITQQGIHPGSISFSEFCHVYMERHAKEHKRSWKEDERRIVRHLLPWSERRLVSITHQDVSKLSYQIGKETPTSANRMVEQLSTMFFKASEWGYLPSNHPNPAKGIKRYDEEDRERFLDSEEVKALGHALQSVKDPRVKAAIKLYIYTGFRRLELLSMKWERVNFEISEISYGAKRSKSKKAHYLPLSTLAIKILKELPQDSIWVFPGDKGGHMSESVMHRAWDKVRRRAGLEDVWLHDLRRTVGSWIVQKTGNVAIVGQVLNQSNEQTSAVYSRFAKKQVRATIQMLGDEISQYLEVEAFSDLV